MLLEAAAKGSEEGIGGDSGLCSWNDPLCKLQIDVINAIGDGVSEVSQAVLGGSVLENTGMMTAAGDQASMWLALSVMVMAITGIIALAAGSVMQRTDLMKRALLGSLLSFPATMLAFFAVGQGLKITDQVSVGLLDKLAGDQGFVNVIDTFMNKGGVLEDGADMVQLASGGLILKYIGILLIMLASLMIVGFAMAFRDFIVVLLIAFAPLGFVLLPSKGGGEWVKRWISAMVAALLAKPLMLGAMLLVTSGLAGVDTVWSWETVSLSMGFVLVAFLPLAAYQFFNFIGGAGASPGDGVAGRAAEGVKRGASNAGNMVSRRGGGGFGGGGWAAKNRSTNAPKPHSNGNSGGKSSGNGGSSSGPKPSTERPGAGPGSSPRLSPPPQPPTPAGGKS